MLWRTRSGCGKHTLGRPEDWLEAIDQEWFVTRANAIDLYRCEITLRWKTLAYARGKPTRFAVLFEVDFDPSWRWSALVPRGTTEVESGLTVFHVER